MKRSRNETVSKIVGALLLRSMWLRRRTLEVPGRRAESLDEHWRLLRAYRDRDAQLAGLMNRLIHLGAARALC
jgi:DNA-binding GntR family transcriptional regulator